MSYLPSRRFDICSIGVWKFDEVGRPLQDSKKKWTQRCNFVFVTKYKIKTLTDDNSSLLDTDRNCGWIIEMKNHKECKECYVSTEHASSSTILRRRLMSAMPGSVCRITSDDFLSFVDEDTKSSIPTIKVSSFCGKIQVENEFVWAFPDVILGEKGQKVLQRPVFVSSELLQKRQNGEMVPLPSKIPHPLPYASNTPRMLEKLSQHMRDYYGPRFLCALHLLTSVVKAIHFDTLLKKEHFVSIANISGPANVGKSFACAIALSMMGAESLMMSRCTPSAMIDAAHVFKNMLIVWDDPRDCSANQLSSIVHEAFHGHSTTSISRGNRRYNSSLIIGTQEHLLGMPYNTINLATFSRLSHVDMSLNDAAAEEFQADLQAEENIQKLLPLNASIFGLLVNTEYDQKQVNEFYDRLVAKNPNVMTRCLRIAAIDWYFATILQQCGFAVDSREITAYFSKTYMHFLATNCSKITPVEHLCKHIKELLREEHDFPRACFKERVTVELKRFGPSECFAIYLTEFIRYLHKTVPESKIYTKEQIHSEVKNSKYGEVSHNVAFRTKDGTKIRRAIVIRRCFI